ASSPPPPGWSRCAGSGRAASAQRRRSGRIPGPARDRRRCAGVDATGARRSTMPARSCVVTGAAMGIGRAIAERLVADGWLVVGVDRDGAALAATAAATGIRAVTGDIADDATHEQAADAAEELAPLHG